MPVSESKAVVELLYCRRNDRSVTDSLQLASAKGAGQKFPGGNFKSERHFLDFVINGQPLWELVGKARDTVSILCTEYLRAETLKAVNRLLLKEQPLLPGNRHCLFICAECGDVECGAVTVSVVRDQTLIIWKDFGYENSYKGEVFFDGYQQIGPFAFDWTQYEHALLRGLESLDPLGP